MLAVAAGEVVVVPLIAIWTSTLISLAMSALTGLVSSLLMIQPIEAQDDEEYDECSSSHCKVIEAEFEHILVRLRFNCLGAADGAAIA